ncbi:hypothetical protein JCGZ_18206 [Jatropha curcas]|uniref:Leucine-rich repeat-containing N-terminal plant-type domain-containing protein n=1 Tax=Jatropha curcas TaxID=180498 RepID=A0A067KE95_JATCU|nr:hypothetical protein JCGZ_18206 [Jatropha curcas]
MGMVLKKLWISIMMVSLLEGKWRCNGCLEDDKIALLNLKAYFNHPNGNAYFMQSWYNDNLNCCQWIGVGCDSITGRVTSLNAYRDEEFGDWYLNASFFLPFKELKYLYLPANNILGCVENEGFERLSSLSNLESLNLGDNKFNMSILPSLSGFSSLKYLYLYYNRIKGTINIQKLDGLSNLEELDLSGTQIIKFEAKEDTRGLSKLSNLPRDNIATNGRSSSLLQSLGAFPYLKILSLQANDFKGKIFAQESHNMNSLEELRLDFSSLSEISLQSLGALPSLKFLSLCVLENTLSAQGICELKHLQFSDMSYNDLKGHFQLPVHSHMSLLELDISNNDFSDSIPNSFSNVSFLKYLQLDGNQFTGNILNSLSNCSFLEVSDISDNHLSGVIPEWMGNMPSLAILDLSRNDISGYLSSNFNPPQLLHVYLSGNRIQGTISKAFYNCFELEVLDLRNNLLNGTIPKWIGERLSLLSYVSLSYNNFEGTSEIFSRKSVERQPNPLEFTTKWMTYSFQRSILLFFSGIDLSVNKLIGEIPPEIGNFEEIKVLNLSHNNLIGQVPSTFGNLNQIESLDISYNNLNWKIPLQITQLHSLEVFSVAFNNLSGKTPDRVAQFATFDKSSYEGNPYLCGLPLPNTCNATLSPPLMPGVSTYEKQEENGFIDMNIFFISFSVAYLMVLLSIAAVLCINPQWRQAWFWFVEVCITNCQYFLEDKSSEDVSLDSGETDKADQTELRRWPNIQNTSGRSNRAPKVFS